MRSAPASAARRASSAVRTVPAPSHAPSPSAARARRMTPSASVPLSDTSTRGIPLSTSVMTDLKDASGSEPRTMATSRSFRRLAVKSVRSICSLPAFSGAW